MAADAITGAPRGVSTTDTARSGPSAPSEDDDTARGFSYQVAGTTLFDETGASLLLISSSGSIDMFAPREKLRGGLSGGWNGSGGGTGSAGLVPDGVLAGMTSGVPSSSIENVSFSPGGGIGGTSASVATVATPEPSSLILLGSGLALAARLLRRRRHSV